MAVRSVIDIDVNDDKFKAFLGLFAKYHEALKAAPGAWSQAGASAEGMGETVAGITAAMLAQQKLLEIHEQQMHAMQRLYDKLGASNDKMGKLWKGILSSVTKSTLALLTWSSITGLAGSAIGLFGLDKLAQRVGDARREAQGLGVTSGEQQAYRLSLGRYVDADANLSAIAEAKSNYANRWAFGAMGVNPNGKDPAQLGAEMALRAKELFDKGDQSQQYAQAHGLLQFYSMEDLRRLHNTSTGELRQGVTSYSQNARALGLDDATQRKWQDLTQTIEVAKSSIFRTFVQGLTPLEKPLEDLTKTVVESLDNLLKMTLTKENVEAFGRGIKVAADYLGSPKFQSDMKTFVTDVGLVVEALVNALKFLGMIPKPGDIPENKKSSFMQGFDKAPGHQIPVALGNMARWGMDWLTKNHRDAELRQLGMDEIAYGVPTGLLANIYGQESSFGRRAGTSRAGAKGAFQFMDGTAKQYGVDVHDFGSSAKGAAHYLADLLRRFHGDVEKAAAAYNWGEGHVERDVRLHGADWKKYLPKETADYVSRVANVHVTVNNNTGGNANVQANQAAAH